MKINLILDQIQKSRKSLIFKSILINQLKIILILTNINKNLTVFIPTYNEEKNIYKTLKKLKKFKNIILADSYSSDKTLKIAKKFKNVKIKSIKFNGYVNKLNSCIKLCKSKWIMVIDADYLFSKNLSIEILNINSNSKINGYITDIFHYPHKTIIYEKIYPSKIVLFKKKYAKYKKIGHKEDLKIRGKTKKLENFILHEDKKSFNRWLKSQINIANEEIKFIFSNNKNRKIKDKIRMIPILPIILIFFYYVLRLNILKYKLGGIIFFTQRLLFETILNLKVIKFYLKI